MTKVTEKTDIINHVTKTISQKLKGEDVITVKQFATQLYSSVALEDLQNHALPDLYGAAVSFVNFMRHRRPEEVKLRIFNPDFEKHGWQSTHTIIELVHEDIPFLVDSMLMEINRMGFTSHLIMHYGGMKVKRDENGKIITILNIDEAEAQGVYSEAIMFIEINRQTDQAVLDDLKNNIQTILADCRACVSDWRVMRDRLNETIEQINHYNKNFEPNEITETRDFLRWIEDHHFTLLGSREYRIIKDGSRNVLQNVNGSELGILRHENFNGIKSNLSATISDSSDVKLETILILSKADIKATVHRPSYIDQIGIALFDKEGKLCGELLIAGLYTSAAYNTNPKDIPFLRRKVTQIIERSQLNPEGHAGKVYLNLLETMPRDMLLQGDPEELLTLITGLYHLQERRHIRLFVQKDNYGRFISCLVYVPRERFNTELRMQMQDILVEEFGGIESTFSTRFSDSVLARIHFVIRTNPEKSLEFDTQEIEKKLVEVGRSWEDGLADLLLETYGEEEGNHLISSFAKSFPASYREYFLPLAAVYDIKHIRNLCEENTLEMNFYKPFDEPGNRLKFKVYRLSHTIPLSDALPILENLGLRVISERPYEIKYNNQCAWINDFGMEYIDNQAVNIDEIKEKFQKAFANIWFKNAENDAFNHLVLSAGLEWEEVAVLRAYAKYLRQAGFTFSQDAIEKSLVKHPHIAKELVKLFKLRFDPKKKKPPEDEIKELILKLNKDMDAVVNLTDDRIMRRYVDLIKATLRTNFFQKNNEGNYFSFKLNSAKIPELPLPLPMFEVFVYSTRFEGIHLRGSKVARGGIRWSDRPEDFRTEVLGLMKAQQVKNAVIVPSGAKGGFVAKMLSPNASREEVMTEGIACYRNFIRGLLDISDNYVGAKVVHPKDVVRYDEDDPYLVVAADKGTATFSDIANLIAKEYNFWLGDAFASGGSTGYDHKKMGITAKGAWECVKRHFRELDHNIQTTDFTVIGIGDMAGDVFGNGLLLSKHIQLVGAFNHMHIFLDPKPDSSISFKERERLFHLPRSSWADYDKKLISKGGGIFSRSLKSIHLTPEIKKALNIKNNELEPNEIIRAMLKAPVDLLWNGGIGTFVKANDERNIDVGDRNNDGIRVNATELRCKVVGEGGNLGFTQSARIEYSMNNGMIYTDFIDNSAGVDCSDHEVNIKILLNDIVAKGDITVKQRNELLAQMTDEVSSLVLQNNYRQSQAISLAAALAVKNIELHSRYMQDLERKGKLERSLEFLPDDKILMERKLQGEGLTRPSIAVLLAYSKLIVNEHLLASDVPEDPYLSNILETEFPEPLRKKYRDRMEHHRLRREIIATQLSNNMVNEMGFTFVYRLQDETGADVSEIVRAYTIASSIFEIEGFWQKIEALDNKVKADTQLKLMMQLIRLVRRSTRWLIKNRHMQLDIATSIDYFASGVKTIRSDLAKLLSTEQYQAFEELTQHYSKKNVPKALARELAHCDALFFALDIIDGSVKMKIDIKEFTSLFFALGQFLDINWIRNHVIDHTVDSHWEALSREGLRDDLDWQQRLLTVAISQDASTEKDIQKRLNAWHEQYAGLATRWQSILNELRASSAPNFTMFFVAVRELSNLTQITYQASKSARKVAR